MILPAILVTDTNIWIDLNSGGILAEVFRLPYEFFTTDLSIQELITPDWETLRELGLQAHDLAPEDILELARLRQNHRHLSLVDLAALLLAKTLVASLVTGDRRLHELARARGLEVHGVLWLLDEMINYQTLTPEQAKTALRKMLNEGARLPGSECQKRFEIWSS
jgi:predicted nucleic acid-binding protein